MFCQCSTVTLSTLSRRWLTCLAVTLVSLSNTKFPRALMIASSYMHEAAPYTRATAMLRETFGQPSELVQRELDNIYDIPALRVGDTTAFQMLADSVLGYHSVVP